MRLPLRRLKKKKAFTFIEVIVTAFLLGLFVYTIQVNLTRLFNLRNLATLETGVYERAFNLFQLIQSGRGMPEYLLSEAERKRLSSKGAVFDSNRGFIEELSRHRFIKNERRKSRRSVKIDGQRYRLDIERRILEPSPFLFGVKLTLTNAAGKSATMKGIISYYDLLEN